MNAPYFAKWVRNVLCIYFLLLLLIYKSVVSNVEHETSSFPCLPARICIVYYGYEFGGRKKKVEFYLMLVGLELVQLAGDNRTV